jgi:hypothetical protein
LGALKSKVLNRIAKSDKIAYAWGSWIIVLNKVNTEQANYTLPPQKKKIKTASCFTFYWNSLLHWIIFSQMVTDYVLVRISLSRNTLAHKTILSPQHFIEIPVLTQVSEQSCNDVLKASLSFFLRFSCWSLELFRQCLICCFHVIATTLATAF